MTTTGLEGLEAILADRALNTALVSQVLSAEQQKPSVSRVSHKHYVHKNTGSGVILLP